MYTTLCSLLLAGSALTAGQCGWGGGDCDEGYGKYGTYGGYGSYSRNVGGGCGYGYGGGPFGYNSPFNFFQNQSVMTVPDPTLEKNLAKLRESLGAYQEKLKELEAKMHEDAGKQAEFNAKQAEINAKQAEILAAQLDIFDKRLVENQKKFLQEFQVKISDIRPAGTTIAGAEPVSKQLDLLTKRIEELTAANMNKDNAALTAMQKHLESLERVLIERSTDPVLTEAIKSIQASMAGLKTNPALTGWPVKLNRSLIIVKLPADAVLYVDNVLSGAGSNVRSFLSPVLDPNKTYFYTLRVEFKRGDRAITETKKVEFNPGNGEVEVDFNYLDGAGPVITNRKND